MASTLSKSNLHPRNLHISGYDFDALSKTLPSLNSYLILKADGATTIDFSNPNSVKTLNKALILHHYGLLWWDIPAGYLCPAVPSRADYIHYVADLLADCHPKQKTPVGNPIKVMDIGTGANLIYPIIGYHHYRWQFYATEVDHIALQNARQIVEKNEALQEAISFKQANDLMYIFKDIWSPEEWIDACICNPPFYDSADRAKLQNQRKRKNLNLASSSHNHRNFGGQSVELWCAGGETGFLLRMINESVQFGQQCLWFTALVAKKEHLRPLTTAIQKLKGKSRIIDMNQGQKKMRILAWSFLNDKQRKAWGKYRWQ